MIESNNYRIAFTVKVSRDNEPPQDNEIICEVLADNHTSAVMKFEEALVNLMNGKNTKRISLY